MKAEADVSSKNPSANSTYISIAYLKNGDYCPEEVVEVFPMTFAACRHDSLCRNDDRLVLTKFAPEKIHSKNAETTPKEISLF